VFVAECYYALPVVTLAIPPFFVSDRMKYGWDVFLCMNVPPISPLRFCM
jgi:hypothetical protein